MTICSEEWSRIEVRRSGDSYLSFPPYCQISSFVIFSHMYNVGCLLASHDDMQCCIFGLHIVWFLLVGLIYEQQVAGILYVIILECVPIPPTQISL